LLLGLLLPGRDSLRVEERGNGASSIVSRVRCRVAVRSAPPVEHEDHLAEIAL
jgi:hypothetical protein